MKLIDFNDLFKASTEMRFKTVLQIGAFGRTNLNP